MHYRALDGVAATAHRRPRQASSIEFVIAVCVLAAALLLAAVEHSGGRPAPPSTAQPSAVQPSAAPPSGARPSAPDITAPDLTASDITASESSATPDPAQERPATASADLGFEVEDPTPPDGSQPPPAVVAAAPPGVQPTISAEQRKLGESALALISYPWQHLGYEIDFEGRHETVRALTFPYEKRITVYVREDDSVEQLVHIVAHEIGHAIDVELNSGDDRRAWLESRGVPAEYPWWPGNGLKDFAVGAGDFAECFAAWDVGAESLSELPGECRDSFDVLEDLIEG